MAYGLGRRPIPPDRGWLTLANIIREVDGNRDLGAGELAERILAHPRFAADTARPGLDVETGRRMGEACASQGHITEDATEDMALAVAAEYARLSPPEIRT